MSKQSSIKIDFDWKEMNELQIKVNQSMRLGLGRTNPLVQAFRALQRWIGVAMDSGPTVSTSGSPFGKGWSALKPWRVTMLGGRREVPVWGGVPYLIGDGMVMAKKRTGTNKRYGSGSKQLQGGTNRLKRAITGASSVAVTGTTGETVMLLVNTPHAQKQLKHRPVLNAPKTRAQMNVLARFFIQKFVKRKLGD